MAIRFRKRIKILPGVHLNVGKNGVSGVSVGPRGASVTIRKDGSATQNIGIPGTGLSYNAAIGGGDEAAEMPSAEVASRAPRKHSFFRLFGWAIAIWLGLGLFGLIIQAVLDQQERTIAANTATQFAPTPDINPKPQNQHANKSKRLSETRKGGRQ